MTNEQKQCLLKYLGYYKGKIDGIFGKLSREATTEFQKGFGGIKVDGIAGEETEKALRHAVCYGMPTREETEPETDTDTGTDTSTGSWWDEIKHFKRSEFRCKCGGKYCDGFPVEPSEGMVRILDKIRDHYDVPFSPNSAIRCKTHNANVGGVANSQHLTGRAADITVPGVDPDELGAYAETLIPKSGGIGIYSWGIHVDDRPTRSRWRG